MEVWTYNLCIIVPCFMLKVKSNFSARGFENLSLLRVSHYLKLAHGYTGSATGSAWIYRKCYRKCMDIPEVLLNFLAYSEWNFKLRNTPYNWISSGLWTCKHTPTKNSSFYLFKTTKRRNLEWRLKVGKFQSLPRHR